MTGQPPDPAVAAEPAPAPAAPYLAPEIRQVAIIDDAFDPLRLDDLVDGPGALAELLATRDELQAELQATGVEIGGPDDITADFLESFAQPESTKGELYAAVIAQCPRLDERREMLTLVKRLGETLNVNVQVVRPTDQPDLRGCQVVFLDYYLEGAASERGGQLAMDHAKRIAEAGGEPAPLLVLMSSQAGVGQFKDAFRAGAKAYIGGFLFAAKRDLNEVWKLRAHLTMLAGAHPRAALIDTYVSAMMTAIDRAKDDLVTLLHGLDVSDYSYLHNVALLGDGAPLGEYLAWLFSSHLGSLVFERELREQQQAVDQLVFQNVLMTPSAPSLRVGELYHSAQFERGVGVLGGHPHDATGNVAIPMVRLGDVFISEGTRRAYAILSAACDLAFGVFKRQPDPGRSVILVPGTLRDVRTLAGEAKGPRTEFYQVGNYTYDIEWDLAAYVTKPLQDVRWFLQESHCDLDNRVRLRPLYALKLQQEFAANVLRIGLPIAPPGFRAAKTEIWRRITGDPVRLATFATGESVVYWKDDTLHARVNLEIATALKDAFSGGIAELEDAVAATEADPPNAARDRTLVQLRSALSRFIEAQSSDDFWEKLVEAPIALPTGAANNIAKSSLFVVVERGNDARPDVFPENVGQGKPCILWRLLDVNE